MSNKPAKWAVSSEQSVRSTLDKASVDWKEGGGRGGWSGIIPEMNSSMCSTFLPFPSVYLYDECVPTEEAGIG